MLCGTPLGRMQWTSEFSVNNCTNAFLIELWSKQKGCQGNGIQLLLCTSYPNSYNKILKKKKKSTLISLTLSMGFPCKSLFRQKIPWSVLNRNFIWKTGKLCIQMWKTGFLWVSAMRRPQRAQPGASSFLSVCTIHFSRLKPIIWSTI